MNLIRTPSTELLQFLTGYVTWRCDLDLCQFDLETCHVMPLGWSIPIPSFNWIRLTVPELRRLQISIDRQLKVPNPNFKFFWRLRGSNFKFHLSNPKKALPWPERRIMTYCARGCVQRCDLWTWRRKPNRTETFMRQTGYLPRPPTST